MADNNLRRGSMSGYIHNCMSISLSETTSRAS